MAQYRDIQKIIEGSTVNYATLKTVARGTPIFPDILMTGEMRFARRLGANFSVMNPDNILRLTSAVDSKATIFPVERTLLWLELNALVTFNGIEMYEVSDWSPENKTVMVRQPLSTSKESGTPLTLWATPLVMHADAQAGDSTIFVRSRYNLLNGDVITFPINDLLSSLTERNVVVAQNGGDSGDPEFPFIFALNLEKPIPIDMYENNSPVYLRAYPGYFSPVLRVPKLQAPSQMGPFLLDYLSTPLDSVTQYPEFFSIRTFDGGGSPIDGTGSHMVTVQKNHPVVTRPLWAEGFIFSKVIRGSGGFAYPNRYRLITDKSGRGRIRTALVPEFPSGYGWTMKVRASSGGLFRVWQDPYGFSDFNLIPNELQTIQFETPVGGKVKRIDFIAKLNSPGAEVVIQDANTKDALTASFQYGLVFRVVGDSNFQSTSVVVKPYFLSLSDLSGRYDSGQTYNSGLIYL